MSARKLVADGEVRRLLNLARAEGLEIVGLDVGPDYVRLIPASQGGESVADYIGPDNRRKAPR
jgi:hypothetical protein